MPRAPTFLMTDPAEYAVSYRINPWMRPQAWSEGGQALRRQAQRSSQALAAALRGLGAQTHWAPAAAGLPDLVFPANAAVVLDGRALLARFRCPERRGEEAVFRAVFERLRAQGVISELAEPFGSRFQEGAGDAIWDADRGWFWAGWGQRSDRDAGPVLADAFGRPVVALQLATPCFYHLDTCFCPLPGGEVLYYPAAFTPDALRTIRDRLDPDDLIEASEADAAGFCANAVCLGSDIVMARPPEPLRRTLEERGYRVVAVDLSPFILSGGAAFCMTLRLDLTSAPKEAPHDRHLAARALA